MNRRQLIQSSLAMAGLPPLCCTTPEIPPASFTFQGAVLVIDLQRAPDLRKPGVAVRVVDLERKKPGTVSSITDFHAEEIGD